MDLPTNNGSWQPQRSRESAICRQKLKTNSRMSDQRLGEARKTSIVGHKAQTAMKMSAAVEKASRKEQCITLKHSQSQCHMPEGKKRREFCPSCVMTEKKLTFWIMATRTPLNRVEKKTSMEPVEDAKAIRPDADAFKAVDKTKETHLTRISHPSSNSRPRLISTKLRR